MKITPRWLLLAALIAAFVALGVSLWAVRGRRSQLELVRHQAAQLDRAITAARQVTSQGLSPSADGTGSKKVPMSANNATGSAANRAQLQVSSDPKLHAVWAEYERLSIEKYFGRILAKLPPEKADRYLDLIVEGEYRLGDINSLALADGLPSNDPQVAALRQEATDELNARKRALLGDTLYDLAQDVERTQSLEDPMTALVGAVAYTEPLTLGQGDALRSAFKAASPHYQTGAELKLALVDWPTVLAQAQIILTPGQYDAFINGVVASYRPRAEFQEGVPISP